VCPDTGNRYTGEWKDGKKDGLGLQIWAVNGTRY
jgi:hypothetical protein